MGKEVHLSHAYSGPQYRPETSTSVWQEHQAPVFKFVTGTTDDVPTIVLSYGPLAHQTRSRHLCGDLIGDVVEKGGGLE